MERQQVIDDLKRVAKLLGKETLARVEFARHGNFSSSVVERTFGSWNKAVEAAGLRPNTSNTMLSDAELEGEFRRVVDALGKTPTCSEFSSLGKHSPSIYERKFGSWRKAVAHYLGGEANTTAPRTQRVRHVFGPVRAAQGEIISPSVAYTGKAEKLYGAPLNFRELRHEPVNEQGVVFLFGMVARELGFLVEAVGIGYPDCKAKQRDKKGYYRETNIEFEFKSINFRDHGHDPSECNLIVCWEHNWPECPIQVIELKSAIKGLSKDV